jgi:DNA repair protein RecN (Recombination protein N)
LGGLPKQSKTKTVIASLSIENFALIDRLSMNFSDGFSIITGETGAGKSILLGALGLALGNRADLSSLKDKEKKCTIEAHFRIGNYSLHAFFDANDLDYEDMTIVRREILPSGKSRAFINDSPVNLQQLQELGDFLIDIHSQHETRELAEAAYQFRIIDAFAGNDAALEAYQSTLAAYRKLKLKRSDTEGRFRDALKERDYNAFLLDELSAADLKAGEQEELESVQGQLANVELIREQLERAYAAAQDERFGILAQLKEVRSALQKIEGFAPVYQSLFERTNSVLIELDDIVSEIQNTVENLSGDPAQLERANQKLQVIYNLERKHGVSTIAELVSIRESLEGKVISVSSLEAELENIDHELAKSEGLMDQYAATIRQNRDAAIPKLTDKLSGILSQLGMPDARFDLKLAESNHYFENGKDELQFLFSANKGSAFGAIKKVASGGEMSRIMLAAKSVLSHYSKLPTIVFDEIDTGVSGEIADRMGEIMKDMSASMQVFAITHLPQIAAKGSHHFKVYKIAGGGQTTSQLKLLQPEERVAEIAQMLSGSAISDSAINHARSLLN